MTKHSKTSKSIKKRISIVYAYFEENDKSFKCCISCGEKVCGQLISKSKAMSSGGTGGGICGNLKRHLRRHHSKQYHDVIYQDNCQTKKIVETSECYKMPSRYTGPKIIDSESESEHFWDEKEIMFSNTSVLQNDGIQGPGSKEMLGILNEEDSGSEAGGDGDYFGRTSSAKFDISIPEELKYVLVSDWDLLTHKKSLFSLPAKITVANILTDYIKNADKLASDGKNSMTQIRLSMIKEVAHGIKGFFDAFIGTQLLYNNERVQFHDEILKDTSGKAPSDIYGSAHLLRLMVRIGGLLDRYNIREESDVRLIEGIISDFLQYLEVNRTKYFTSKNYVEATDEYLAKAFSGSMDPVN